MYAFYRMKKVNKYINNGMKEKVLLFGTDRNFRLSGDCLATPSEASWCQTVTLEAETSVRTSQLWKILIVSTCENRGKQFLAYQIMISEAFAWDRNTWDKINAQIAPVPGNIIISAHWCFIQKCKFQSKLYRNIWKDEIFKPEIFEHRPYAPGFIICSNLRIHVNVLIRFRSARVQSTPIDSTWYSI